MSEPIELSAVAPYLVLAWFATLLMTLANLALDEYRLQPSRSLWAAALDWIGSAGVMSIVVMLTEIFSRNVMSLGSEIFIVVMLFAVVLSPRIAASAPKPEAKPPLDGLL